MFFSPAFLSMLGTAFLFAALTVPGFILGRFFEKESGGASVGLILQYAAMPALVFFSLCDPVPASFGVLPLAASAAIPAVLAVLLFFVTGFVFPNGGPEKKRRVLRVCSVFPNCGFFGIPLAAAVFPDQPEVKLCVAVFNVVSTVIYLTLGTFMMSGVGSRKRL